ncbi:MAG: DUF389 domain-containing protein [Acidobacteriaceae bacterium]|nr:DUF389 domain-containing protein [Acidobacteriaceae bacterium]MBV9765741.1 DUF389 domain-containing protein [Acidobacteriaceae bacterium]
MHEIRVTVPQGRAKDVAELALRAGITQASVYPVFAYGPNQKKEVVSAETSTPKAKQFADSVLTSSWFDIADCSISSRELRAVVTNAPPHDITQPMLEPPVNVFEDLWQLSHVTPSYIARAFAGAILLAHGMMQDNPITIVVAALFLPFLSQVLAISFGAWAGDLALAKQGIKALVVSTVLSIAAGAIVTLLQGPPMLFYSFTAPLPSFALAVVIGVTAGILTEDDAGRRYLIGVAAAVSYGIFPVWFGFCLVAGFPAWTITATRLSAFAINVACITGFALIGYLLLDIKRKDVRGFVRHSPRGE